MSKAQTEAPELPVVATEMGEEEIRPISDRVTVIRPVSKAPFIDVHELWQYREVAGVLAWRDFSVRYKQTAIGIAWAILQPLIQTVVFTVIFGYFADFPSDDLSYIVFTYSGLLIWTYFASSLARAGTSLVFNKALITKVYFPRILLPTASVVSPVMDLVFASSVLWALMLYYDTPWRWTIVLAPVFVVLTAAIALGLGLFLSAINVRYRDVPYVIPLLIQMWMFLSAVVYSPTDLPDRLQWVYSLNPLNGVIIGWRWALLGSTPPTAGQLAVSVVAGIALLVAGIAFFRRWEPRFADTI